MSEDKRLFEAQEGPDKDQLMLQTRETMELIVKHLQHLSMQIDEKTGKIADINEFRREFYDTIAEFRGIIVVVKRMEQTIFDGDRSHSSRLTVLEEQTKAFVRDGAQEMTFKQTTAMWISVIVAITSVIIAAMTFFRK